MAVRKGLFDGPTIDRLLREQREAKEKQENQPRQAGFVDFGGGAVLPVDEGGVRFPSAGRAARSAITSGGSGMFGIASPAEQYQMAQGALGAAMKAIDKENYSRVSQGRELRRMAHEQELARIQASADMARANADRETALIRELLSGM